MLGSAFGETYNIVCAYKGVPEVRDPEFSVAKDVCDSETRFGDSVRLCTAVLSLLCSAMRSAAAAQR